MRKNTLWMCHVHYLGTYKPPSLAASLCSLVYLVDVHKLPPCLGSVRTCRPWAGLGGGTSTLPPGKPSAHKQLSGIAARLWMESLQETVV